MKALKPRRKEGVQRLVQNSPGYFRGRLGLYCSLLATKLQSRDALKGGKTSS